MLILHKIVGCAPSTFAFSFWIFKDLHITNILYLGNFNLSFWLPEGKKIYKNLI